MAGHGGGAPGGVDEDDGRRSHHGHVVWSGNSSRYVVGDAVGGWSVGFGWMLVWMFGCWCWIWDVPTSLDDRNSQITNYNIMTFPVRRSTFISGCWMFRSRAKCDVMILMLMVR